MACSRDRSRSPMFRTGDSEITMMLRMQDKIYNLENQIAKKDNIINGLKLEVADKSETIAELKVQIIESKDELRREKEQKGMLSNDHRC